MTESRKPARKAASKIVPPMSVDTDAIPVVALDLQEGREIPRKQVWSWAMWDWATQPFNTVILTFVFTSLYLTSANFIDPELAALPESDPGRKAALAELSSIFGLATTLAGLLIAFIAPVLAQRADAAGKRKRWLLIYSTGLILSMAALWAVEAAPGYFLLGIALVCLGSIFSDLASVNYNAMVVQVATPKTVGKVSGLGWGLGYIGGILAMAIVVVLDTFNWFGMDVSNGLAYRWIAVGCAVWGAIFLIPLIRNVPEIEPRPGYQRVSILESYRVLGRSIMMLWRNARQTFWFLIASAVYRDGLAGIFAFGAIIAAQAFGFSTTQVIIFGIAANLVAGLSTIIAGRIDDAVGPRAVIMFTLGGMIVAATAVFALADLGAIVFWAFGLFLCCLVGPAQSASRSLLARVTPANMEGEVFGLYATTGRVANFMSSALWALFIWITKDTIFGILGIVVVLLAGFLLMLPVKLGGRDKAAAQ